MYKRQGLTGRSPAFDSGALAGRNRLRFGCVQTPSPFEPHQIRGTGGALLRDQATLMRMLRVMLTPPRIGGGSTPPEGGVAGCDVLDAPPRGVGVFLAAGADQSLCIIWIFDFPNSPLAPSSAVRLDRPKPRLRLGRASRSESVEVWMRFVDPLSLRTPPNQGDGGGPAA